MPSTPQVGRISTNVAGEQSPQVKLRRILEKIRENKNNAWKVSELAEEGLGIIEGLHQEGTVLRGVVDV